MSKAVYYKTYSSVPTDLPEIIYFYKLRPIVEFVKEHLGAVELYANYIPAPETCLITVYNFPNDADYDSLLSDPRHPTNAIPVFNNDPVIVKFRERRNIVYTLEIIDNWTVDETLNEGDFSILDTPPMTEEEIQIYNAQVAEIETYMEQKNFWGPHTDLFKYE